MSVVIAEDAVISARPVRRRLSQDSEMKSWPALRGRASGAALVARTHGTVGTDALRCKYALIL